jgi:uncharacterized membrane protein
MFPIPTQHNRKPKQVGDQKLLVHMIEHWPKEKTGSDLSEANNRAADGQPRTFLTFFILVAFAAGFSLFWTLGRWSWDVDEVETLQELHLTSGGGASNPGSQFSRSPRLMPIWYWCQSQVMAHLPLNERNARLLPALCGLAFVLGAFVWAWRDRGKTFAILLAVMILASPLFLALAQQIRFYTMAVLFQFLAQVSILSPVRRFPVGMILLSILLSSVAILCHNLLLVYFVLGAGAALVASVLGWCNRAMLVRSLAAAAAGICLYFFYLRHIIQGWNEFLPHRTSFQAAISLLSEVGIPMLALSLLGVVLSLRKEDQKRNGYWAVLGVCSVAFILAAPLAIWFFNYRYTLLFLLPIWILAAKGAASIGNALGDRRSRWAWYACAIILLMPKAISYYQDGSRRDIRTAAEIVSQHVDKGSSVVYCNLPAILHYYLPNTIVNDYREGIVKESSCYVVLATNAWDAPLRVEGRVSELVATVGRRRFDEQSYLVRIYHVSTRP